MERTPSSPRPWVPVVKLIRRWWPVAKWVLIVVIVGMIARQFARDLARPELWERAVAPGWLVLAAAFYMAALTLSGLFWQRLLGWLGTPPGLYAALRAYHVGHVGKFLPGKAMALVFRVGLVHDQGVPPSRAALTAFYEVLTTMASGSLLAAGLFLVAGPAGSGEGLHDLWSAVHDLRLPEEANLDRVTLALLSLALFAVTCGPLLPPVFNRLVDRITRPFRPPEGGERPPPIQVRFAWLFAGLAITTPAWVLMGVALGCALQAVPGAEPDWAPGTLARLTAVMGLSYVAGFVLIVPGGLGVREYLLALVLVPDLVARQGLDLPTARAQVVLAVLLLRLAWTAGEVLLAAALFPLRPRKGVIACPN